MSSSNSYSDGIFDFDNDGETSFTEEMIGYDIINKHAHDSSNADYGYDEFSDDEDMNDEFGFDSDDWRYEAEVDPVDGIDPWDYDSEDEYLAAVAEQQWAMENVNAFSRSKTSSASTSVSKKSVSKASDASTSVSTPPAASKEKKVARPPEVKREDYATERQYDAAKKLNEITYSNKYSGSEKEKQLDIERCNFVLNSSCIAAKYMTYFGKFMFIEAISENFNLPGNIIEKMEIEHVDDLISELAEINIPLAVDIWKWCIKEFGPYMKYTRYEYNEIYRSVFYEIEKYPEDFVIKSICAMEQDTLFFDLLTTTGPDYMSFADDWISFALLNGHPDFARKLFLAVLNFPKGSSETKVSDIKSIIRTCDRGDDLYNMELLKEYILPVIGQIDNPRVQRLIPEFTEDVNNHILYVERHNPKYQFSRSNEWKAKYKDDGKLDSLLRCETEQEYLDLMQHYRNMWRRRYWNDKYEYGVNPEDYETEAEFKTALRAAVEKSKQEHFKITGKPMPGDDPSNWYQRKAKADPLAETDMTVYTFIGVRFSRTGQTYYYLYDGKDIDVGDKIVIPVGSDSHDKVVEVATVQRHRRATAPYPLSIIKNVKCKYTEET